MQLTKDDQGLEYLSVNGQKPVGLLLQGGTLGRICSIDQDLVPLLTPGMVTYEEGIVAGAVDPHERIKVLDEDGIDAAVLYPSLGLSWQAECRQADVAEAYCRAYNDWLFDFCRHYPQRLIPVAMISMIEVEGAVTELARAGDLGAKGMMLSANSVNGRPYGDAYFDPFWAEAQRPGGSHRPSCGRRPQFPRQPSLPHPRVAGLPAYPLVVHQRHGSRQRDDRLYDAIRRRSLRSVPQSQGGGAGERLWMDSLVAGSDGPHIRAVPFHHSHETHAQRVFPKPVLDLHGPRRGPSAANDRKAPGRPVRLGVRLPPLRRPLGPRQHD